MLRLLLFLHILSITAYGQFGRKEQKTIQNNLQKHIEYLSNDKLEGRRAGTEGEKMAADYISEIYKKNGLKSAGNLSGYIQTFSIVDGKKLGEDAYIKINGGTKLEPLNDFFPFPSSANVKDAEYTYSHSIRERGSIWNLDLSQLEERNRDNVHFDLMAATRDEVERMASMGAGAVLIYKGSSKGTEPVFDPKERSNRLKVPTFYIRRKAMERYLSDTIDEYDIALNFEIQDSVRTAMNVVGYVDNGSDKDIVIGAHYDHLGYGEDGNSMTRSNQKLIHNGADDNASGTAALLELSRIVSKSKLNNNNYIFIAFSAEEIGLNGSKHYVENPALPLNRVNYMINMDMVGRLNDTTRILTIGGYGTSPMWSQIIDTTKTKELRIKFDSSGTGPSDHTSFYRKNIPVLFFFTGLHSDYHKPSDDFDKINYIGLKDIVMFVTKVMETSSSSKKLEFLTTRERQTTTNTRFSVSLGVMPDYSYSGFGLRVDGVTDGRPAKTAGIKAGDIVVRLGDIEVSSVESYMRALSRFKKGDETTATINRGKENIVYKITFQ